MTGKPGRGKGRPSPDESVGPAALIELTCRLLDRFPPGEITRATIAREANVDPALIRYYFKNREALLRSTAMELTDQLRAWHAQRTGPAAPDVATEIAQRALTLFQFKLKHPYYHRLMLEEIGSSENPESQAYFVKQNNSVRDIYASFVERGVEDGTVRPLNPGFLYLVILGLGEGFASGGRFLRAFGLDPDDPEVVASYADFIGDFIARAVRQDDDWEVEPAHLLAGEEAAD